MKNKKGGNVKNLNNNLHIVSINENINKINIIEKKLLFFKDIIEKTLFHVKKNKTLNILSLSDVNTCVEKLFEINNNITKINSMLA
jgi:hypothetical protein